MNKLCQNDAKILTPEHMENQMNVCVDVFNNTDRNANFLRRIIQFLLVFLFKKNNKISF